ncbi:hypothetical protein [Sphingobacterium detergens]|uniref:Antibiotic biosynthesis monooxygenase (ABM) superfamily enzyme n=1 Tax=Sphingobacterium detergens TaxID=1145106 RepID=A0A420BJZ0_SPHD1|nr:hypothetical protein [Sphingobacterium detergens]RKE57094.1 antibiotic biosynthesis monooxygenase (ABM) superfamily enzyme [Sphingobacterium detergens]
MISTIVVRYKLLAPKGEFEEWKKKMDEVSRRANGFLDRIELPMITNEPYFFVLLRFDKIANAEKWLNSLERLTLLKEVDGIAEERQQMMHKDSDFWFAQSPKNAVVKWKQIIVSFIAVYPLTQIIPRLVHVAFTAMGIKSALFSGLLAGMLISACMVYFAMPIVLRLFRKWL